MPPRRKPPVTEAARTSKRLRKSDLPNQLSDCQALFDNDCGACLLPLMDVEDKDHTEAAEIVSFARTEACQHLFHTRCLKAWADRDTSCPLCRLRFRLLGTYSASGHLVRSERLADVSLADVLAAEELSEEEEGDEDDELDEIADLDQAFDEPIPQRTHRRSQRHRQEVQADENGEVTRSAVLNSIDARLNRELRRMHERLTAERQRELRDRRMIISRVDTDKVRNAILTSLKRLPYNLSVKAVVKRVPPKVGGEPLAAGPATPPKNVGTEMAMISETRVERLIIPDVVPKRPALQVSTHFQNLRRRGAQRTAVYEEDFLLVQKKPEDNDAQESHAPSAP